MTSQKKNSSLKKNVPLHQVSTGYVLAKDVHKKINNNEVLLIKKDVALEKRHLLLLKNHGITQVEIYEDRETENAKGEEQLPNKYILVGDLRKKIGSKQVLLLKGGTRIEESHMILLRKNGISKIEVFENMEVKPIELYVDDFLKT